ncbi:hypothetical protein B4U80_14137 [Leptotrombidium deliense]|uniref:Uncharacterized protein n=1 Tax=Leptotrombidium deliense TaxID=299467 RepID=A0A443S1T2_9ACAR|nr:hypothetical protein B4U80_14137 [Leptotrombidium deliense]
MIGDLAKTVADLVALQNGIQVCVVDERDVDTTIPEVDGRINGRIVSIKLDSGCQTVAISKRLAEKLGLMDRSKKCTETATRFIGAGGEDLEYCGSVFTRIDFGTPFFDKHHAAIDFLRKSLFIDALDNHSMIRIQVPFKSTQVTAKIRAAETTIIPPRTEYALSVTRINTFGKELVEWSHNGNAECRILNGINFAHKVKQIMIVNYSEQEVLIREGQCVGSVHAVEKDTFILNLDTTDDERNTDSGSDENQSKPKFENIHFKLNK